MGDIPPNYSARNGRFIRITTTELLGEPPGLDSCVCNICPCFSDAKQGSEWCARCIKKRCKYKSAWGKLLDGLGFVRKY
jgi:hypothetical protein